MIDLLFLSLTSRSIDNELQPSGVVASAERVFQTYVYASLKCFIPWVTATSADSHQAHLKTSLDWYNRMTNTTLKFFTLTAISHCGAPFVTRSHGGWVIDCHTDCQSFTMITLINKHSPAWHLHASVTIAGKHWIQAVIETVVAFVVELLWDGL